MCCNLLVYWMKAPQDVVIGQLYPTVPKRELPRINVGKPQYIELHRPDISG